MFNSSGRILHFYSKPSVYEDTIDSEKSDLSNHPFFDFNTVSGLTKYYDYLHSPEGENFWNKLVNRKVSDQIDEILNHTSNEPFSVVDLLFENTKDFLNEHKDDLLSLADEFSTLKDVLENQGISTRFDLGLDLHLEIVSLRHSMLMDWLQKRIENSKDMESSISFSLIQTKEARREDDENPDSDSSDTTKTTERDCVKEGTCKMVFTDIKGTNGTPIMQQWITVAIDSPTQSQK